MEIELRFYSNSQLEIMLRYAKKKQNHYSVNDIISELNRRKESNIDTR